MGYTLAIGNESIKKPEAGEKDLGIPHLFKNFTVLLIFFEK